MAKILSRVDQFRSIKHRAALGSVIPSQPYTHTRSNTTTGWAKRVYIACERTDYILGEGSLFIQERVASRPWIVPPIQRSILNPYHHYIYTTDYSKATRWSAPGSSLGSPWVACVRPLGRVWACVRSKIRDAGRSDTRPADPSGATRASLTGRPRAAPGPSARSAHGSFVGFFRAALCA